MDRKKAIITGGEIGMINERFGPDAAHKGV
jgi:hypothetical protein